MLQYKPLNTLASKLNLFMSVNGPLLGSLKTNGLVSTGMSFIKAFGKKDVEQCVRDLENQPIPRERADDLKFKVRYMERLLDYDYKMTRSLSGMCNVKDVV